MVCNSSITHTISIECFNSIISFHLQLGIPYPTSPNHQFISLDCDYKTQKISIFRFRVFTTQTYSTVTHWVNYKTKVFIVFHENLSSFTSTIQILFRINFMFRSPNSSLIIFFSFIKKLP